MRIVWDVSPLSHPRTGVGNYLRGALRGLIEAAAGEDEVVALAPIRPRGRRLVDEALAGLDVHRRTFVLPRAHWWRSAWSRAGWPPAEKLVGRFDVLHFSDWMYPPQRSGVRATTVHDVVPLRFPEWTLPRTRSLHTAKYRNAARTCDIVFANSHFTANEAAELLGIDRARVRVAYPGVDPRFRPDGERAELGRPYVLSVATLEPRKNLGTLLDAYEVVRGELALAVVGAAGWGEAPALDRPGVVRLGYVPDAELARLYRGASVFAFPSRFEGFGMPVIEAMASGVPCVVSSHPSLDEACGDAALRADADDPSAFARAIEQALGDRDRLIELGLRHAARFEWRATGETLLEGYSAHLPG